jgi:uncharacterized protein with HEPN domain
MAATKSALMRLRHIQDEIINLLPIFEGVDFSTFAASYWMIRTSERAILIIGEAVKVLPLELTQRYPEIEWHAIRGMSNILRHEYERVESEVLWHVIMENLPRMAPVIAQMIRDLQP